MLPSLHGGTAYDGGVSSLSRPAGDNISAIPCFIGVVGKRQAAGDGHSAQAIARLKHYHAAAAAYGEIRADKPHQGQGRLTPAHRLADRKRPRDVRAGTAYPGMPPQRRGTENRRQRGDYKDDSNIGQTYRWIKKN